MSSFQDTDADMYVTKRNQQREIMSFDKILKRIKKVGMEVNIKINYTSLAMKVIDQLYDGISTTKIDELTSEQCASLSSTHPDYNILAGRIAISNHHKNTKASFYQVMKELYQYKDQHGTPYPLISHTLYKTMTHYGKEKIDHLCDYSRDYLIDYFGFKTLERAYLMRINKKMVERPQHMWLRVALGIHDRDWDRVVETYTFMSQKYFTHATPTLFNAGTPTPQLSSCYLMGMEDDSIDGIFNTLKDCALISKWAGGIGLHIHNVRASGSQIRGTNGTSNGIVPMLKVYNNAAKYVDQCIVPDTYIYTTQGPMKIQDVMGGETEIFNHKGTTEVIENVLEHPYEGTIYKIHTAHGLEPLQITGEHPVYALTSERGKSDRDVESQIMSGEIACEYIEAKHIQSNDFLVYKVPTYEKDVESITLDDCYMYGILFACGTMSSTYFNGYLSLHKEMNADVLPFVEAYFSSKCVHYDKDMSNTKDYISRIRWNKHIGIPFRHSDLYDTNNNKRIANKWLHLPKNKIQKILKGIIHTGQSMKQYHLVYNSSRIAVEGIRYILLRVGVLCNTHIKSHMKDSHVFLDGSIVSNEKNTYIIEIPKTKEIQELMNFTHKVGLAYPNHFISRNQYLYSRVISTETAEYHGTLYDLQMSEVHDYMIHNGIVHNGGGKRNGSFAIYLEPWHADIELFLQMRKNHGDEELKARDLFYALWVPDLFMERIKTGGQWALMCPAECPGLSDVFGEEFVALYEKYEREGKYRSTMPARDLWFQILDSQMETGTPYLLYKDAANRKSNQKNLGTIKSSNLCVSPDTMILTKQGYFPIYSLWSGNYPPGEEKNAHEKVAVWNGDKFSSVEIVKTGENVSFYKVHTTDGSILTCTPYHKFYICDGDGKTITKQANELLPGDLLEESDWPILNGTDTFSTDCPIQKGNVCGIQNVRLSITSELDHNDKFYVPVNHTMEEKMKWLSGFIEPYVSKAIKENATTIRVPSLCGVFLENLKYMLQTCGINTIIHRFSCVDIERSSESELFPYAHSEWIITMIQLRHLKEMSDYLTFSTFDWNMPLLTAEERDSSEMNPNVHILKTEITDIVDDSYCFTEPIANAGIFNGIRTSQCTEIIEYSDKDETAVCNLASIALPAFVNTDTNTFDYDKLHTVTRIVTRNLNRVIDINYYPTPKTEKSNMRHRPIGLGVQGLADVFFMMKLSFSSPEAKRLNIYVFETIYHAALEESCLMSQESGPYETFDGSPASQGILQFDMWENATPSNDRYNWDELKTRIQKHGLRNSLLLAPMPTASTSQILGYNECIEPITSNIYSRRTLAGEFVLVNKYLMQEMLNQDLWNESFKNQMVANNGSIQGMQYLTPELRELYRTVWEIPMKDLIDMAADRGAYICQSQSLNLWLEDPNYNTMTSMHFYSWQKGLKTGIYYLRRRPRHHAQQFTIEPKRKGTDDGVTLNSSSVPKEQDIGCEMCSA
jgi:ribonucleoside-diphosphate reductase alpha chain